MNILHGKRKKEEIEKSLFSEIKYLKKMDIYPTLATVVASNDDSIISYVSSKKKQANNLGIKLEIHNISDCRSESEAIQYIKEISFKEDIHGIMIESPIKREWKYENLINSIPRIKDIDGLGIENLGMILSGDENNALISATPQACIELIEMECDLLGKNVVILGRGKTVGRPLYPLLVNRNATVTMCHTKTKDIQKIINNNEIIISAVGKANFISTESFSNNQIVIDVGINYNEEGKLVGDIKIGKEDGLKARSPVPGGVGPITSILIYKNLIKAIKIQRNLT
ncbi:MAG: bifunctional 5,10-methylenetetrahydrofolate dehydrogenase/5,10-methenyltetrahydrofolate cyclohydrolase [Thiolinea sp.]